MQPSSYSGKWSVPVILIVDLSLARVVQHSPFRFYALPTLELSLRSVVLCGRMRMLMMNITLRVQNLTLSSLPHKHTYIHTTYNTIYIYTYIHMRIKPLPVSRVFGASSGSPRLNLRTNSSTGVS